MNRTLVVCLLVASACGVNEASSRATQLASPLCKGDNAKKAFTTNAVCTCEDLNLLGAGFLAKSGATPANVGVNGVSHIVGLHEIGGALVAMKGITGVGDIITGGDLATTSDVLGVGKITVGRDMMVGGRVDNIGLLEVSGVLGVKGDSGLIGWQTVSTRGAYQAPAEPCDCNARGVDVDVLLEMAHAKESATQLGDLKTLGKKSLRLKSGTYYADNLASLGALDVTIDGAVSLSIGGSLETAGLQNVRLTPGSTLDLYVAGGLATVGASVFGDGAAPGAVRLFLGGQEEISFAVGAQTFNAALYAPMSTLVVLGDTHFNGAVFAKSIAGAGRMTIDYTPPARVADDKCVVPPEEPLIELQ